MISLIITDQTGAIRPRVYPCADGLSINEIITDKFGELHDWNSKIYLNGCEILPQEKRALSKPLTDGDEIKVVTEVKGVFSGFTGVAEDVLGFVVEQILDIPDLPEQDTQRGSPNNTYQSQTNVVRAFQQKALVCGSPRVYPDLIQEAIEYFDNNNDRVSEQYLYVTTGNFTGGTIQLGNTASSRFQATVERYQPVSGVTTIPLFRVGQPVDEVDGQVIRGTNEGAVGTNYPLIDATGSNYVASVFTAMVNQTTESDQLKSDFDAGIGDVRLNYNACIFDGFESCDNQQVSGTGSVTAMTLSAGVYTIEISNFNGQISFDGAYSVVSLSTIISSGVGPFETPIQTERFLFNIAFRQGLKATVDFELVIYELDSKGGSRTGNNQTFTFSYTDDQPNDAQNRTYEAAPARGIQWYEFELTRTNEESQDTQNPDVPTLDSVYCIVETGNANRQFQNATMLRTIIRSTPNATGSGVSNRINIINGQQNMPSYNRTFLMAH